MVPGSQENGFNRILISLNSVHLKDIMDSCWILVFEMLDARSLGLVALTCRDLAETSHDRFLWRILFGLRWLGVRPHRGRRNRDPLSAAAAAFEQRPRGIDAVGSSQYLTIFVYF